MIEMVIWLVVIAAFVFRALKKNGTLDLSLIHISGSFFVHRILPAAAGDRPAGGSR